MFIYGDPSMVKCRRKPVVMEAVQWFKDGDHPDVISHPVGGPLYDSMRVIETKRSYLDVNPGDWIIKGVDGDNYVYSDEDFKRFFELCG